MLCRTPDHAEFQRVPSFLPALPGRVVLIYSA